MRDAAINLRVLPEQIDLIDYAARLLGKSRSDFVLETACERAEAVVLDQVLFTVDTDAFKQFTKMLDAPAGPNPGLERLMATKPLWDTGPGISLGSRGVAIMAGHPFACLGSSQQAWVFTDQIALFFVCCEFFT